jgi:hypothetical protein
MTDDGLIRLWIAVRTMLLIESRVPLANLNQARNLSILGNVVASHYQDRLHSSSAPRIEMMRHSKGQRSSKQLWRGTVL